MTLAVDASALLAVLFDESDAEIYLSKLVSATTVLISPVNWWEVQALMHSRNGAAGEAKATKFMDRMGVMVAPMADIDARLAFDAFTRFGGRPARLNLGDCFALALAQSKDVPLLYKGNDFVH